MAPQSWILYQDQVCTIDPIAIATARFQLQFLYVYVLYINLYLGQYFNYSLSLAHNY